MGSISLMYRMGILIACCLLLAGSGAADLSGQNDPVVQGYKEGSLLVKSSVAADGTVQSLQSAHAAIGATIARDYSTLGVPGLFLVTLPGNMTVKDAVSYYSGQPGVAYAEPDYYRQVSAIPQDPDFWRQWGLQNTGQVFKENTTAGKPGADINATAGWDMVTGGGTIVAVLDTGTDYLHPDLAANIWTDQATGTHGYDTITGTLDPMDQHGHGTHCAGIIGAVANNGIGTSGVSWNATVMPVRWLDSNGIGRVSDEISAITWAYQHGARIMSCSYGYSRQSKAEEEVIAQTNALFIVSAGNSNDDIDIAPTYPASLPLPNIITVAATTAQDTKADFSNYGPHSVHLGAPGADIYSTYRSVYIPVPVLHEPFDTLENWTPIGNWTSDTTRYVSAPASAGIFFDNTGENATGMSMTLTSRNPLPSMAGMQNPVISYQIEMDGNAGSVILEGSQNGMYWVQIDLTYPDSIPEDRFVLKQASLPESLRGGNLVVRFRAEGSGLSCNIDDLILSDGYGSLAEPRWVYMSGTSMAAPMVSGVAALLSAKAPGADIQQIRDALLSSTDPIPDLEGLTVTGGRVNLTAALNAIGQPPDESHIPVLTGWNHISVPYRLEPGTDTAAIFSGINSSGHSVLMYQNDTAGYRTLSPTDLVVPLQGYWLYSANSTTVPVTFAESVIDNPREVPAGWSSIGGWSDRNVSANLTLVSLKDAWTYLVGYNAETQQYEDPIIRGSTGNQSDDQPVRPWQGYWLYCSENGTYQRVYG